MSEEIRMCKETEKLIRILEESENPTDMALIILANKIDGLDQKIDKLKEDTKFAAWITRNKRFVAGICVVLLVFACFGIQGVIELLRNKLGL